MSSDDLATYALVSLYSAMAVLTVAMLAHALYLARAAAEREDALEPPGVLVGAGGGSLPQPPTLPADAPVPGASPSGASRAAGIARSFTWLATLLLAASVLMRGLAVRRPPIGNLFEFACAASLALLLAYCAWGLRRDVRWLGVFVVTPVLLLLGVAVRVWFTEAAALMPSLQSYWLSIHVTVAIISVGLFSLAGIVTGLYLLVDRLEKQGSTSTLTRVLPGSRELERLSYSMHIVAFPLWTFTLIAGAIWARQAWASYWNWDPKEVWTFIIWVVYAAYLHARATTGISRQRAAYIALAGVACIILNFTVVNMFFVGQHSYSGL